MAYTVYINLFKRIHNNVEHVYTSIYNLPLTPVVINRGACRGEQSYPIFGLQPP